MSIARMVLFHNNRIKKKMAKPRPENAVAFRYFLKNLIFLFSLTTWRKIYQSPPVNQSNR